MSSLSFSLRGGDGGTCGRSEFSRLAELIYACVPLFLLHQVSCLRISSEQTEMPPPGPLMQSASVETSPRSSLDIAE